MRTTHSSEQGFSLVEVVVAMGIMCVGLLGAAAVLGAGMQRLGTSPNEVVAVQKAAEAIESVFSGRDSHKVTWAQLRNVAGLSGSDGGVFLDGPKSLQMAGADGLVNTVDDGAVETVTLPGVDQNLGTADDKVVTLLNYQREIAIRDIPDEPVGCGIGPDPCTLRSVTVTVTYQDGKATRTYTLTTYISNYS
jgi:prepilin-type N-terminal cleavage/methylation domain-containing protein